MNASECKFEHSITLMCSSLPLTFVEMLYQRVYAFEILVDPAQLSLQPQSIVYLFVEYRNEEDHRHP